MPVFCLLLISDLVCKIVAYLIGVSLNIEQLLQVSGLVLDNSMRILIVVMHARCLAWRDRLCFWCWHYADPS